MNVYRQKYWSLLVWFRIYWYLGGVEILSISLHFIGIENVYIYPQRNIHATGCPCRCFRNVRLLKIYNAAFKFLSSKSIGVKYTIVVFVFLGGGQNCPCLCVTSLLVKSYLLTFLI